MSSPEIESFRQRAWQEADRYGTNSWIFVRELVANARDAGARRIQLTTSVDDEVERISCRDDGAGMSYAQAERFLFTLYASDKAESRAQIGRFGVGFWSVLRFHPTTVIVRSRPRRQGHGWEVRFTKGLEQVSRRAVRMEQGTEIILERARASQDLHAQVAMTVVNECRLVRTRNRKRRPVELLVDGLPVPSSLCLAPPNVQFERRGLRGVVGLAAEPLVELWACGVRVRSVVALDDLLHDQPWEHDRRLPDLPESLVPHIVLDSDRIEVLLDRSDASDDRVLRTVVETARRELARVVARQLDRSSPMSAWERVCSVVRRFWEHRQTRWVWPWLPAAALLVGAILLAQTKLDLVGKVDRLVAPLAGRSTGSQRTLGNGAVPYSDLRGPYHGPSVDLLAPSPAPVALRYSPATESYLFAVRYITDLVTTEPSSEIASVTPFEGVVCNQGCVEVRLEVEVGAGYLRLPRPTGYSVVAGSLRVAGVAVPVLQTSEGEQVVWLATPTKAHVSYRVGPAVAAPETSLGARFPDLPDELARAVDTLATLPLQDRVSEAQRLVRSRVRYDRSLRTIRLHREAADRGVGLFDRALGIGMGDCDVINALLAAVLTDAEVQARLAIGYIGSNGAARSGLHAWVEYLDQRGRWQVADASIGPSRSPSQATSTVPRDEELIHEADDRPGEPAEALQTSSVRRVVLLWLAASLGAAGLLRCLVHRWTTRQVQLEPDFDITGLVAAALEHPETFAGVGSLYQRPLVPLHDGDTCSLERARRAAASGKLYQATPGRTVAAHALVLNRLNSVGSLVANHLLAKDLDEWSQMLEHQLSVPLVEAVNEAVHKLGERWRLSVTTQAREPISVVEPAVLGSRGHDARIVVMLQRDAPVLEAACALAPSAPAQAAFVLVDAACDGLDLSPRSASKLLQHFARVAVAEVVG